MTNRQPFILSEPAVVVSGSGKKVQIFITISYVIIETNTICYLLKMKTHLIY